MRDRSHPRKRTGLLVLILLILVAILGFEFYWLSSADARVYRNGTDLMESGDYQAAIAVFESLPEHAEAARQIPVCYYKLATSARLAKDYETARQYYILAGEYSDSPTQAERMTYTMGHEAFLQGDYDTADSYFAQLNRSLTEYGNPHFATLADAADYLTEQRLELSDRINFHIDADSDETLYQTLRNIFPCQYYYANYYEADKLMTIAGIHYYPGENILYALRNDDTSRLTEEELQVLELAQQVVRQALEESTTPYETELWLHDWLCDRITYESPNMDIRREDYIQLRELSCIGAMLDGIANCQGYADAFYLLGNMAGLEVGRVLGVAGEGHIWNTIKLDGQWYIVDVTFDDYSDQEINGWGYTYFNTFWDTSVYDPDGDDSLSIPVTTQNDNSQTLFHNNSTAFTELEDAADSLVSQYVVGGSLWTYAMVEGLPEIDHDELDEALSNKLWKYARYDRSFYWTQWYDTYGGNTYLVVLWQE